MLDNAIIAGLVIPDTLQVTLLLAALPSTWRSFITTQSTVANQTVALLASKIKQEQTMNDHSSKSASTVTPMAMNTRLSRNFRRSSNRFNTSSNSSRDSRQINLPNPSRSLPFRGTRPNNSGYPHTIQCTYCQRLGHLERECRTKQREQRPQMRYQPRAQARIAQINESSISDYTDDSNSDQLHLFAATIHSPTPIDDEWYFDTGATHHMTFNKNWLTRYTSLSSPLEVRLGDDSTQYAEGFGLLQIHLPNGQNTSIDRVYYVPVSNENAFTHSELQ